MVKKYTRICDGCKKEIKNLYDFGVTTLYHRIRIGRGNYFHDYEEGSKYNGIIEQKPNDYDSYRNGWRSDDNMEFSFCSPECLVKYFKKLYVDTFNSSIKTIQEEKNELNITIKEFKKRYGEKIPFFKKIQTTFSKNYFKESIIEKVNNLLKEIKIVKKQLEKKPKRLVSKKTIKKFFK